jgi:hypothetical protein
MAAIGQLFHAGSLPHQVARPNPVSVTMPALSLLLVRYCAGRSKGSGVSSSIRVWRSSIALLRKDGAEGLVRASRTLQDSSVKNG